MKALHLFFSIIVLFVIVLALAMLTLVFFIDPNKLKPVIIAEVKQHTGYEITINGQLSWSFYPILGVNAEHMTLSMPNQKTPFAVLCGVKIATKWTQLLRGDEKPQGDIYIANLQFDKIKATHAHIGIHWQDSVLSLQPITASLYQGSLTGVASGRELSLSPKWNWNVELYRVQLQPLLEDINGVDSKIKLAGIGDIKLRAITQGKNPTDILNHLNGSAEFSMNHGALLGIDLDYFIQAADALINKQNLPPVTTIKQTDFEQFNGSAIIANGIVKTNDLHLVAKTFTANAQGILDLLQQSLDMHLQLNAQQVLKTQWEIPLIISGPLRHPSVRIDTIELNKFILKQDLEKVRMKVKEEIQTHIPGKAGEFLQNLLGK